MKQFWLQVGTAAALAVSAALPLGAQEERRADGEVTDRIVAVVGRTAILQSELDEKYYTSLRGRPEPGDATARAALKQQVLQEMIDEELLYQLALTDTTVRVTDEEVTSAVDEQIRNIRRSLPNDDSLRAQLRATGFLTIEEYRRWLTDQQRRQLLTSSLVKQLQGSGKIKPVIPTDRELRAVYEQEKGRQRRPESVSFRQIIIAPRPSDEARQRAVLLADSILVELRKGADFATAARRFSSDPASKEQGGSLGWFRRGVMYKTFEDVAFNLRPGVVSNPIETPYGFHLIQVERVQPAEVSARHILISPELTQADADSTRAMAERIRSALMQGASFDSIVRIHHDPMEEREVRDLPADKLLPVYATALQGLADGGYAEVIRLEFEPDPIRSKFAVIQLTERKDAGEYRFEDVKDQLRRSLGERLAIRRYLDKLREVTYVDVREID
jgi:peptidyl-prolyl cis-trans isomerase SurA